MKATLKFLAALAALGAVVVLSSCAISAKPAPARSQQDALRELHALIRSKDEIAILFIGNSYSFGVPRELKKLTTRAHRKVRYGEKTHNGWALARHSTDPTTLAAIHNGHWDIIVLQEYSTHPANPISRETMMVPGIRFLASEARKHGAIPILYQTWGKKNGDPTIPGDTFQTMNQRVRDGYRTASRKAGGLVIVPAGDAWEKEFESNPDAPFYQPDGHHPTRASDAVTARVFYETLFAEPAP
ncbi:MAG: hypothetical protein ACQCXQ_06285 [Verrucomicrobiales bacterium]|nr:hypothetical protein [Verrucomicrobiota bacterium JB025]